MCSDRCLDLGVKLGGSIGSGDGVACREASLLNRCDADFLG